MNVLDLFSGIGGFSLGLERAGMKTVAFCEIDKFCRKVLTHHWPTVPIYEDIKSLTAQKLKEDNIIVDVICGGFPCQDISTAGKGEGLKGERSGLWREYARLIGEIRPRYVIVENVAALLFRGLPDVLGDLASLGYDAEWHCIPASYIGAPHRRDRIWILAYPNSNGQNRPENPKSDRKRNERAAPWQNISSEFEGSSCMGEDFQRSQNEVICNPDNQGESIGSFDDEASRVQSNASNSDSERLQRGEEAGDDGKNWAQSRNQLITGCRGVSRSAWEIEPNVGRVANGVPARMDRLKSLGNAVVPQIPEILGKAIMSHALRNA
jgi:DNA (cytosine-5)-methyltransferase 1